MLLANTIDGIIPLVGGIYALLMGFGVIKTQHNSPEKKEKWERKGKIWFQFFGAFLTIWGIVKIILGIVNTV